MAWLQVRNGKTRVLWREDGKVRSRAFASPDDARAFKHEQERGGDNISVAPFIAELTKDKSPTLADFARPLVNTGRAQRSRDIYGRAFAKIEASEYGATKLRRLAKEPALTRAFLDGLTGEKGIVHQFLQKVFNQAIREQVIAVSPLKVGNIKRPPTKAGNVIPITVSEVERLADTAGSDWLALCIRIGAYTGLRGGEIGGLRPEDVSVKECRIHVRQQITTTSKGPEILDEPKHNSVRRIPVPCSITDAIAAYIARHSVGDDGLIFHTERGNWVTADTLTKRLYIACKSAGIRPISSKGLRHVCASILIASGADIKKLSTHFGHKDGGVLLLQVYGHLYPDHDDAIASGMQALIDAATVKALPEGDRKALPSGDVQSVPKTLPVDYATTPVDPVESMTDAELAQRLSDEDASWEGRRGPRF